MLQRAVCALSLILLAIDPLPLPAQQVHDLIIRNGRVLDGSGSPWYYADVAVNGDRITAVGRLAGAKARRVIDATGLFVAPGFIDVHSHSGPALTTPELSAAEPLLAQGITTVVVNPDGGGPVDLAEQRAALLKHGLGVNVAQLVPHGSVRRQVMAMADRPPTSEELTRMKVLVQSGMEQGAFGLSSGLYYAPGSYAATEEVIELAKIAADYDGIYTSHIRDEADYSVGVVAAVDEVIRIAREAKLPGIVTHIKALGPRVWGYSLALVERIERARTAGIEVWADQYAYEASGTSISGALVPRWAQVGGSESLRERMESPEQRARLRADMLENLDRRGGAARLQFQSHEADPSIEGKTLQQVADELGIAPVDLAIDLLAQGGAGLVSFNMSDADIELLMRQPWTLTCSDGGLVAMGERKPHPRFYGAFPRKIRKYVVEKQVLDLATAIRSMTGTSAQVFRFEGRGVIKPGAFADIVVFDLAKIRDMATYDEPHQLSQGIRYVLVNGHLAIEDGRFKGEKRGRVLSRKTNLK